MAKRMYMSKRHLYFELQARNNNKLRLKKPPVMVGCVHFRMFYPPSVRLIRTHPGNRIKTRKRKQNEEERKKRNEKGMTELMHRIFVAEQRSMDSALGNYP